MINEALLDKTTEAVVKIQQFGYGFYFEVATEKYQACHPDGTVAHEFDGWEQIIAFADNICDKRGDTTT